MNECTKYENLLTALAAGELDEQTASDVRAHIQSCPACAKQFRTAEIIEKALTPCVREVPLGFAKSVALRITDIAQKQTVPSYGRVDLWWFAPYAAALVVIAGIAWHIFKPTIPSYTQWMPKLIGNPWALLALFAVLLGATVSAASVAVAGYVVKRNK